MKASFQHIALDSSDGDDQAVLVFRDDRLVAVLSQLGVMHGDITGRWFVEAMFGDHLLKPPRLTFLVPSEFVAWLENEGCGTRTSALVAPPV